ncbi:MAG: hypothetical protein ACE5NG_11960 [bacterium]
MPEKRNLRAFPGLRYFKDHPDDRQLFFGRENEIIELTEKIIAEDITILFGESGDGKTSLINVGLKQSFRNLDRLPVYARIFHTHESSPIEAIYQAVGEEASKNSVILPKGWKKNTLWETFFYLRPTEEHGLKPIVLILDQFEELFTFITRLQKCRCHNSCER